MCLALYKPADKATDWEALENAMTYNPDGAGFAVAVNGQLIIEKGFFRWEDFRKAFEPFSEHAAIVHFRLATHGEKNAANCHPFALADFGGPDGHKPVAVIHNGIFYDAKNDQKQWSDTWHICRDILHPLWLQDPDSFGSDHLLLLGDKFVGGSNKLVFLAADGTANIWGESNGHWKDGVWYSNHSYQCSSFADPRYRGSKRIGYSSSAWDDDDYVNYWDKKKKDYGYYKGIEDDKELEEFAVGKLPAPGEDDFSDEDSILDLSQVGGPREQAAFAELRLCNYPESEIEEIYLDDGLDGLIEELADMYGMSQDDMSCYLSSEAAKLGDDDDEIEVHYDFETNTFVPAK